MKQALLACVVLLVGTVSCLPVLQGNNVNTNPKKMWSAKDLPTPDTAVIPLAYPLFLQCDPIWGLDFMGGNSTPFDTVCHQGCAMSAVAMALSGKGYHLNSYYPIYSGTFNAWLRYNGGYTCIDNDCDNLVLTSPERLGPPGAIKFMSEVAPPSAATMRSYVDASNPAMIVHVRNQTHFVLVTGYDTVDTSLFYVNDPGFPVNTYHYSDIHNILLYSIEDQKKH
eukprot:TRINITY_DN8418_c0_g1_i1.p1 TRINITY_DN8418_c0_g1~~TRINITY_DN8418_c0_g1_i1.p1  ORF type:complete len:224 (-),score=50.04 TRINITY_DN8418_c0_g1_i1:76-747(-)